MAYPPQLPPVTRTDSTLAAVTHAKDHNQIAAALRDLVAQLGAGPAGGYANLTDRLLGIAVGADQGALDAFAAVQEAVADARDEARAAADNAALIALGDADATLAGAIGNPDSLAGAALSNAIGPRIGGFSRPAWTPPATVTTLPIGRLGDGLLYGAEGTVLKKSGTKGASWTTIRDLGATGGTVITIMDTSEGEVIIVREQALYRTTGWAANPATATITKVLDRIGLGSFYQWSVDTNPTTGLVVATTYVGAPPYNDGRYVWASTDGGKPGTFNVIFDLADHVHEVGTGADTLATAHLHFAKIDKWAGDRVWVAWHGSTQPSGRIIYTDNLGGAWTALDTDHHPTICVPTKHGIAFGSDDLPQGVYTVARNDPQMRYRLAYRWPADADGDVGWGQWGTVTPDGETALIAFIADVGDKPVVVASDGVTASEILTGPTITTIRTDGYRFIEVIDGTLIAADRRGTTFTVETAPMPGTRVPTVNPGDDPGWVLGGTSGGTRATAVGYSASAPAAKATVVGANATGASLEVTVVGESASSSASRATAVGYTATAGNRAVALGAGAAATGPDAVAVGENASTGNQYATAVGPGASASGGHSVAIGHLATANTQSTSVGKGAKGTNSTTSVGHNADAKADLSTVVGHGATGGGAYGTVIGQGSTIGGTTQRATVLGQGSSVASGHVGSTALGSQVTTTAAAQTAIGARHIEFTELAADPTAPAANNARVYTRDNGAGKTQLCVRFATGVVMVIATEP